MPFHTKFSWLAFAEHVCFPLPFLTLILLDVQKKYISAFYLISLVQNSVKSFREHFNKRLKFSRQIISTLFWLDEFIKYTATAEDILSCLGLTPWCNQILILWCLHFGYCTGQDNEADGHIGRENLPISKLK